MKYCRLSMKISCRHANFFLIIHLLSTSCLHFRFSGALPMLLFFLGLIILPILPDSHAVPDFQVSSDACLFPDSHTPRFSVFSLMSFALLPFSLSSSFFRSSSIFKFRVYKLTRVSYNDSHQIVDGESSPLCMIQRGRPGKPVLKAARQDSA